MTVLRTARLVMRPWRDDDLDAYATMTADPEVMRYFPAPLDRARSDASARRIRTHLDEHGWGLWAIEVPDEAAFIGFVGLQPVPFASHFTPAVEVGWRLARPHWGRGFAPEAARMAIEHGFGVLGVPEIVSMTIPINTASRAVMEKIGMSRDPADDFDHPNLTDWVHRRHVLYRIRAH